MKRIAFIVMLLTAASCSPSRAPVGGNSPTPTVTVTVTATATTTRTVKPDPVRTPYDPEMRSWYRVVASKCLNLRVRPSSSAETVRCLERGVYLRGDVETFEADGYEWIAVMDPEFYSWGWVVSRWLRRVATKDVPQCRHSGDAGCDSYA